MAFIAGPYTATYGGQPLGIVEDGFELITNTGAELITGDSMGDSELDGVYRGNNLRIKVTLLEFNQAGAIAAYWPWSPIWGQIGAVGALLSTFSQQLLLAALPGTNAVPALINFQKAVIDPRVDLHQALAAKLRRTPMQFIVWPILQPNGKVAFFTWQ